MGTHPKLGVRVLRVEFRRGIERVESGNLGDVTWQTPIVVLDGAMEPLKIGILHGSDGDDRERVSEKRREWELRLRHWRVFEASQREKDGASGGKGRGGACLFLMQTSLSSLSSVVMSNVCDLILLLRSSSFFFSFLSLFLFTFSSSDVSLSTKFHTPTSVYPDNL